MLAAPWLLGARVRVPGVIWVTCAALAVSFCLTAGSLARFRRFRPSPMVLGCVLVLLGYLVVFAWRGEPEFATAFSKEFYADLNSSNPAGFIAPPWHERLALHASCLLTVLTVSQLGRLRTFRRRMAFCFGFSALAVVAVSLMQRWAGLGSLPWVLVEGTPERCNAGFFHYSATAACINLGWPFVVFSKWGWASWRKELGLKVLVFALVMAALVPLRAEAATAVAIAMLLGGCAWSWFEPRGLMSRRLVLATVAVGFLAVGAWQFFEVRKVQRNFPDGWTSAVDALRLAPERDREMKAKSLTRGDRLVPSEAPIRPVLWLAGARMAVDHPVIGQGPGSWPRLLALYSNDPTANTFFHAVQFTHNDPLQFAAEWGIVPAFLFLALVVRVLLGGAVLPALVLLGFGLHSTVDFPMQCPALMVVASMMIEWGLSEAAAHSRVMPGSNPESSCRPRVFNGSMTL